MNKKQMLPFFFVLFIAPCSGQEPSTNQEEKSLDGVYGSVKLNTTWPSGVRILKRFSISTSEHESFEEVLARIGIAEDKRTKEPASGPVTALYVNNPNHA